MGRCNKCAFHNFGLVFAALIFFLHVTISLTFDGSDSISVAYSTDYESQLTGKDANQLISYRFVPLHSSRAKRQAPTPPEEEPDKSLLKGNVGTKKPTGPVFKSKDNSVNSTLVATVPKEQPTDKKTASSTQSVGVDTNSPTQETPATGTMKVFPLPKSTETSVNETKATIWLNKTSSDNTTDDDDFPLFPKDLDNPKINNHTYYTSTYYRNGSFLWIELENNTEADVHDLLSDAHRRAATVKLEFEFPFYGHMISNVTMATGGFLYLGQHVHAWLAATQYVAPLMANFDSRVENATVRYLSNATQFTVQWHNVFLHDSNSSGTFNFQATLYQNGSIVFAYKEIPLDIQSVNDTNHPVKVGLSDAYISERSILFVKQKTIYEYHRIDLTNKSIVSGSAFVFTALPTCPMYKTCEECTNHETMFDCVWCPTADRCSDGTDRNRQDWLVKKCATINVKSPVECHMSNNTSTGNSDIYHNFDHENDKRHLYPDPRSEENLSNNGPQLVSAVPSTSSGIGASGVVAILFFLTIVLCIGGWIFYAYYYPHTPSGQLLIRFRPSQWGAFRRGEARYTAASIHM